MLMKLGKEARGDGSAAGATGEIFKSEDASLGVLRNMQIHRNRFIRFRLESVMRFLIALVFVSVLPAMSLKDFNAKPDKDQAVYALNVIDRVTDALEKKDSPRIAQEVRDWFTKHVDGKPIPAGMERLYVELGAIELKAKDGKADLSKIQIEGVIVYVIKQQFPAAGWVLSLQK